jgi:hypothetical protein
VIRRCRRASALEIICAANGSSQPVRFGAYPPVMIKPTPPRARSAKYAASRSVSRARSSRPVCIEPITTRLRSVEKPRSNGDNNFG